MRYIGNKTRLLEEINSFITDNVKEECFTFCDLFSGTGSVGSFFKNKYKITSNDYLYFSYIMTSAYMENNKKPSFRKLGFDPIEYFNNKSLVWEGFIFKNFSTGGSNRMYFSENNSKRIDFFRNKVEEWLIQKNINQKEYNYLLTVLLESISKVSNIAGVYGSYLKKWDPRAIKDITFYDLDLKKGQYLNKVYNKNAVDLIENINGDILYLDPPYTKNDYITQYHLLETIIKNDKPELVGITGTRKNKIKSSFTDPAKVLVDFEKIISNAKFKYIILSYSDKGIMSKDMIEKILKKYSINNNVVFKTLDYRKYSNKRTDVTNDNVNEYLFLIEKKQSVFIESPLNYMGSKFGMLEEVFDFMGDYDEYVSFVDVFGGGFNVGINSKAKNIVYNDTNFYLKDLISFFKKEDAEKVLNDISSKIKKYGLKKKEKEPFLSLRKKYNSQSKNKRDLLDLYLLLMYGFQQQFRFNLKHEFNNTLGMSDYNDNTALKIVEFSRKLKEKNIILDSKDFENLKIENNSIVYCDPPYYITLGSYNDGKRGFNGWNQKEEVRLYSWLDKLNKEKKKFVLSNVLEYNGKKNTFLDSWLKENNFEIKEIMYRNRKEILVKNY